VPVVLLAGLAGGLLGGFFGVGGGIVLVPLILWIVGLDRHAAHATSLVAISLIAVASAIGYATEGSIDYGLAIGLGMGAVAGSVVGAALMHRMSPEALRLIFATALVAAGLRMVW
jgi:uncharacterized membrane protein YfcA